MSIYNELLNIYDNYLANSSDIILGFENFASSIEIIIDLDGNFITANSISKENSTTPMPVTTQSANRTSGIAPLLFNDKLDYMVNNTNNEAKYTAYISQLDSWRQSEYTHPFVDTLYKYITKNTLINDLINIGVIATDEQRIPTDLPTDFIRIIINDSGKLIKPWEDTSFCESAYEFAKSISTETNDVCYITGEMCKPTYTHNKYILCRGDGAKLISTKYFDDQKRYQGRFSDTHMPIGAEVSLKIHNALRWLINNYSVYKREKFRATIYSSCLTNIPNIMNAFDNLFDDDIAEDTINTMPKYNEILRRKIFGCKNNSMPNESITLLMVDAATTGRMNISKYSELSTSEFYSNIEKWHREIAWARCFGNDNKKITSFSVYDILNYAFGRESKKDVTCDNTAIMNQYIPKLIECITEGRKIPIAIVNSIYNKVSNPQSYKYGEKCYGHKNCIEVACGVIRKYLNDYEGRDVSMAYDENNTNRSYLYGCLLAIADLAEWSTYDKESRYKRETNARRYWKTFSSRPYTTWTRIYESLMNVYFGKLKGGSVKYEKWIRDITSKMNANDFTNDTKLSGDYILGYNQFTAYMWDYINANSKSNNNDENSKED